MKYLKQIFDNKIQDPEWEHLIIYQADEIEKLCSNFSFDRDFKKSIDRCLTDLYGEGKYSYDKTNTGFRRLVQVILCNMNWYCHSKRLYKNQINLPGLRGIGRKSIDSIYFEKNFIKGVKRLFDYMWAFRKAIFIKSVNQHADVLYLQKRIFKILVSQELIKTKFPDSKDNLSHIRSENARKNTTKGENLNKIDK